jgi:hypothetical protein
MNSHYLCLTRTRSSVRRCVLRAASGAMARSPIPRCLARPASGSSSAHGAPRYCSSLRKALYDAPGRMRCGLARWPRAAPPGGAARSEIGLQSRSHRLHRRPDAPDSLEPGETPGSPCSRQVEVQVHLVRTRAAPGRQGSTPADQRETFRRRGLAGKVVDRSMHHGPFRKYKGPVAERTDTRGSARRGRVNPGMPLRISGPGCL